MARELGMVKKEIQIHRKLEVTRREMEDQLAGLAARIKELEEEREGKRVAYEEKIKAPRLVQTQDC